MDATCPVCAQGSLEPVVELPAVPVLSTAFHPDRPAAMAAPRGDLSLAVCRRCALVWNRAFVPELVEYDPGYENSQHFSAAFRTYARSLAARLGELHALRDREVVEIGSGKGEFLAELCAVTGCRGVGFDPTFDGEVDEADGRVRIVRGLYDAGVAAGLDPALVLARHVVEHLADPVGFLRHVRVAGPAPAYYEVPDAGFVFSDDGMWDLIYQHVGYFSRPTLRTAVERAGYEVRDLHTTFHGQFLGIDVRPSDQVPASAPDADEVDTALARIDTFAERLDQRLTFWRDELIRRREGDVVLWGAGAKGVAFLNLLDDGAAVDRVVDVNPRKSGRFVPGTGHRIESPAVLAGADVRDVLILNPAYQDEIETELQRLGSAASVRTV